MRSHAGNSISQDNSNIPISARVVDANSENHRNSEF